MASAVTVVGLTMKPTAHNHCLIRRIIAVNVCLNIGEIFVNFRDLSLKNEDTH